MEYVIVVTVIALVMIAMSTMIKRGTQGMIKVVADQVGDQIDAEQRFGGGQLNAAQRGDERGSFLESSYTSTRRVTSKTKTELIGTTTYTFGDSTSIASETHINMGFTEEN